MSSSPTSSSSSESQAAGDPFAPLRDLVCPVEMVLGHATITVGDCLELEPRKVIRLTASAGEDLQLVVGGVAVMRGEVVLVDQSAAVRITEITRAPGLEG